MTHALLLIALTLSAGSAFAVDRDVVLLWPGGAPGSEGKTAPESVRVTDSGEHVASSIHKPSLTVYLPEGGSAVASVVVAPGGGHRELWMDHEGHNVADWLSRHGVAAFVLKYRLAREKDSTYAVEEHVLADIQRAVRLVRSRASEWGIDPDRIGVMGFSAGGEVAALAAARYDDGEPGAQDPIDRLSSKPAFQALIYPAIPREMRLSERTPPAFLACGENDRQNISQGLPELYIRLKQAGASAELHVFAGAGHGFGVRERNRGPAGRWLERFHDWLNGLNFSNN